VAKLSHWKRESDLAGIRDAGTVTKLPADERGAWAKLRADVVELERKAAGK
jgi:hypothetical protein